MVKKNYTAPVIKIYAITLQQAICGSKPEETEGGIDSKTEFDIHGDETKCIQMAPKVYWLDDNDDEY